MSRIKLSFAELQAPFFLAGTNLGQKLDPAKRTGLALWYDRAEKELLVSYEGKVSIVPTSSNVISMTPEDPTALKVEGPKAQKPKVQGPNTLTSLASAQASTPQDHVFAKPSDPKTNPFK